jgi:hypothetical protein
MRRGLIPFQGLSRKTLNSLQFYIEQTLELFPRIEFIPSSKGFFIERLRRKLEELSLGKSNEIVTGRFLEIDRDIKQFYAVNSPE